jgi:hypothetical protein
MFVLLLGRKYVPMQQLPMKPNTNNRFQFSKILFLKSSFIENQLIK